MDSIMEFSSNDLSSKILRFKSFFNMDKSNNLTGRFLSYGVKRLKVISLNNGVYFCRESSGIGTPTFKNYPRNILENNESIKVIL